jgi:putative membrane protein
MSMLFKLAVTALAVWVAVQLVDGLRFTGSLSALIVIALILALVNAVARPIVTFFSFPIVLVTLGLFLLVINAMMFALTIWISGELDLGLTSTGFGATFVGALIVTVVSWIGEALLGLND